MREDLKKVLDQFARGSLTIDECRNQLDKIKTENDSELFFKNNLMSRLSELLVRAVVLQDEINEFILEGVILTPMDDTEFLDEGDVGKVN